ncbi:hypothetical protein [Bradyrhizobium sp. URHC0002]
MPDHQTVTVAGKVTHIFGHRFVVQTDREPVLADITPRGLEQIELRLGDSVELSGEQKPSELKVTLFTRDGRTVTIAPKEKHHDHLGNADPKVALNAARAAGFATLGEPRRKPKHFEVLGKRDAAFTELHIELDGHIRKMKPVDRHDPKWMHAIGA